MSNGSCKTNTKPCGHYCPLAEEAAGRWTGHVWPGHVSESEYGWSGIKNGWRRTLWWNSAKWESPKPIVSVLSMEKPTINIDKPSPISPEIHGINPHLHMFPQSENLAQEMEKCYWEWHGERIGPSPAWSPSNKLSKPFPGSLKSPEKGAYPIFNSKHLLGMVNGMGLPFTALGPIKNRLPILEGFQLFRLKAWSGDMGQEWKHGQSHWRYTQWLGNVFSAKMLVGSWTTVPGGNTQPLRLSKHWYII